MRKQRWGGFHNVEIFAKRYSQSGFAMDFSTALDVLSQGMPLGAGAWFCLFSYSPVTAGV